MNKTNLFLLLLSFLLSSCISEKTFTDPRDNQVYDIVKMEDGKTWFAQNLNYDMEGSFCNQCERVGRLYTWEAIQNACPKGWHLPSADEWITMFSHYSDDGYQARGNVRFQNDMINPLLVGGSTEFNTQFAGWYDIDDKEFERLDVTSYYWSSTAISGKEFYRIRITKTHGRRWSADLEGTAYACRCVKD